jgi:hypothetical protein
MSAEPQQALEVTTRAGIAPRMLGLPARFLNKLPTREGAFGCSLLCLCPKF